MSQGKSKWRRWRAWSCIKNQQ